MKKRIELAYLVLFGVGCLLEAFDAGFERGYRERGEEYNAAYPDTDSGDRE